MHVRRRFWAEIGIGAMSLALLLSTAAWPDWIERVFGVDPDRGDGSLEWALVVVVAICAVALPAMARSEWRRARPNDRSPGR